MPQLLIELFSEEIPARMQANAARDLERMAREKLAAEGLLPEALKTFAGPRRLTLVAEGLPAAQSDRHEERKGPRVGSPDQAIEGFLRSTGLTRDQLTERDGVYFAHLHKQGRPTAEIVAEMAEAMLVVSVSRMNWLVREGKIARKAGFSTINLKTCVLWRPSAKPASTWPRLIDCTPPRMISIA